MHDVMVMYCVCVGRWYTTLIELPLLCKMWATRALTACNQYCRLNGERSSMLSSVYYVVICKENNMCKDGQLSFWQ